MSARTRDPARQAEIAERRRSSTRLTVVAIAATLLVMLVGWAAAYVQRLHATIDARDVALRATQARIEQLTAQRDALQRELDANHQASGVPPPVPASR